MPSVYFFLHTAFDIEIVLNDECTSAEEVVLSVELAEDYSVCDILAYKTYHFTLYIVKLLFVELVVVKNYLLCKVADREVVDKYSILRDEVINYCLYRFFSSHESHEHVVGIDFVLVAFCEFVEHRGLVL